MIEKQVDVAVIGAGPAGLAAALSAKENGAEKVLLLERDSHLGGILPQCIHNGFGLLALKKDFTGPEYADYFAEQALARDIEMLFDTMVIDLTAKREIWAANERLGQVKIQAQSVVLAMGCRERPRGALAIPGTRPAGILTAGTAQRLVNIEGYLPGKKVVILGSGDIGLIMARRLTLEGAEVKAVVEILPYISGLVRNYVQCVRDFDIPLQLTHTVTRISGDHRIASVCIAEVDSARNPVLSTERQLACDCLLLSVGLIPENELSKKAGVALNPVTGGPVLNEKMETSAPGIFACGNVSHVFDLVDYVTWTGELAGRSAAAYAAGALPTVKRRIRLAPAENVRYVAPEYISQQALESEKIPIYLRVKEPQRDVRLTLSAKGDVLHSKKIPVVLPGEMVRFELKTELASKLNGAAELTVSIAE